MLKVGIAGYGIVGKRRRACIDKHSKMKVTAVCDQAFSENGVFSDGVMFFQSYSNLLLQDLDVLLVCLSNDVAANVTIEGLRKGLHVFCEKPPGRNVRDIMEVIAVEQDCPTLKLMYGFNHRHHNSIKDALQIIKSGELGNIINLRGVYGKSKLVTFNQTDWRTKRDVAGGGVLLDQGIHMVDLMRLFAGEFEEVHSFISSSYWGYEVEDNAYAIMRSETGVVGMINSSATQWRHRFNLDINLEQGSLVLGGILSGTKSYGDETLTIVKVDHDNDNGNPSETLIRYNKDPSWEEEMDLFCDAILLDKDVSSGSSQDALGTMTLVYKIYHADPIWRNKYKIESPVA